MRLSYFEPLYTTHPALLSAGVACGKNAFAENWYLNHTSRIYGRVFQENGKIFTDSFLGCGDCWSIPFLYHKKAGICLFLSTAQAILHTAIERGFYCNLRFDQFDFSSVCRTADPGTKEATLYGFARESKTYFLFFPSASGPQRFSLPAPLLLRQIKNCTEKTDGTIEFLRVMPCELLPDPVQIRRELEEYVVGAPYREAPGQNCSADLSGIEAADLLRFSHFVQDRYAANRANRILLEHKICMQKRLSALERMQAIGPGLALQYQSCVQRFLELYHEALQGDEVSPGMLAVFKNEERAVLARVLDSMDKLHEN